MGPIPLVLRYCEWHQRELDFQKQVGKSKVGWLGLPAALENFLPGLGVVLHVEPKGGRVALHKGKATKALDSLGQGKGNQGLAQGHRSKNSGR